MTLWSDFLRRMMLGASLSGSAVAAGADDALAGQPPAEVGERTPDRAAAPPTAGRPAEPPSPARD